MQGFGQKEKRQVLGRATTRYERQGYSPTNAYLSEAVRMFSETPGRDVQFRDQKDQTCQDPHYSEKQKQGVS